MIRPYLELNFPEIVRDTREIFSDVEALAAQRLPIMKSEGILTVEQPILIEERYERIAAFREKYPFLDRHTHIFNLRPKFNVLAHIDGHATNGRIKQRPVSINIPISGCNEHGITKFFSNDKSDFYLESRFGVRVVKPGVELVEMDRYVLLDNPIVMTPQVPHSIENETNFEYRLTVSWTLNLDFTWETAHAYFVERGLGK